MEQSQTDRRRGRRVDIRAPMLVRRGDIPQPNRQREYITQNIGLAGVYFETDEADGWSLHEVGIASISIPETEQREFPFTRLAGRGRVVRLNELSAPTGSPRRYGVALEFSKDLTALTAVPSRG